MKLKACLETFPRYSSQMNHHLFAWLSKLKKELPGKVNRNAFSFVSKFVDQWHDIEEDFPMMVLARDELEKIKKQRFPHTRPIEEWRIHQSLRRKMTGENGQYFTIAHNVSMTFHLGPSDYKDLEWMQSLRFLWPPQECQN